LWVTAQSIACSLSNSAIESQRQTESPRLLICVGRVEKCVDALRRVAKMNRVELSESKISSIRNFKHTEAPVRSRIRVECCGHDKLKNPSEDSTLKILILDESLFFFLMTWLCSSFVYEVLIH